MNVIKYNQENNCVALGTPTGFYIYTLDPVELRYKDTSEGIGCIEMLYCTSLVAVVGSGITAGSSPRKLKLWNLQNKELICELNFPNNVIDIKLSKRRMVVVLPDQIHIFDLNTLKCIQILASTSGCGAVGLLAYSMEPSCLIAFPSSAVPSKASSTSMVAVNSSRVENTGDVLVYDTISLRLIAQVHAHKASIVSIEFNPSGNLIATASSSGTMIRVFSIPSGQHLFSFRRGASHANINKLSFDSTSSYLLASSSNKTIHVFSLLEQVVPTSTSCAAAKPTGGDSDSVTGTEEQRNNPSSNATDTSVTAGHILSKVGATALTTLTNVTIWSKNIAESLGVLPEPVQEFSNSIRAIATVRLPIIYDDGIMGEMTTATAPEGKSMYEAAFIRSMVTEGDGKNEGVESSIPESLAINKIAVVTRDGHYYRYNVHPDGDNSCTNSSSDNTNDLGRLSSTSDNGVVGGGGIRCTLEDEAVFL